MKRNISRLLLAMLGVFALSVPVKAQSPTDPLPMDKEVRMGARTNVKREGDCGERKRADCRESGGYDENTDKWRIIIKQ